MWHWRPQARRAPSVVLSMPAFQYFWYSQLLVATVSGTIRFRLRVARARPHRLVAGGERYIGLAVGLPMTLLSLPASVSPIVTTGAA